MISNAETGEPKREQGVSFRAFDGEYGLGLDGCPDADQVCALFFLRVLLHLLSILRALCACDVSRFCCGLITPTPQRVVACSLPCLSSLSLV